ncbi:MAG: class I SAM-dependent methyltransferase [Crocinitomicaceae bacterium]|nr:class I SAM-dependent methyltransferase [Crocinitomicaceae bacterium]
MEFISKELDDYVCAHTEQEPKLLYDLNRRTHLEVLQPRMLSGQFQGRALSMFSHMIKPKNILEIGTYTGYSAVCMAEGLAEGGKIITIDKNEELEDLVKEVFWNAGLSETIDFKIGNAMEIVPQLDEEFDLVFIDADKGNYGNYYDMVIDKMPSGGFILLDNVLWSGKVLKEAEPGDVDTKELIALNKRLQEDDRVQNIILPIRDGLTILRKK